MRLLLLFLLIPFAMAETENIYDEWHSYHDFFTVEDDYYEVTVELLVSGDNYLVSTLLQRNQVSYIITAPAKDNGDGEISVTEETCKTEGYYSFCIVNLSLDPANAAATDEHGSYRYGTRIKIYKEEVPAADLDVVREIDDSSLLFGEKTRVFLRITNVGTDDATNIMIDDSIGEGLLVTDYDDLLLVGNTLQTSASLLRPDEELVYDYWVTATGYVNTTTLDLSVTYDDPLPASDSESSSISITWPFTASFSLSPDEITIGGGSSLAFTITNAESDPLPVALTITYPRNIYVTPDQDLDHFGGQLLFSGTLEADESKTLTADIEALYTGDYDLSADLSVEAKGESLVWSDSQLLVVSHEQVTPSLHLNQYTIKSGEDVIVTAYLTNEDQSFAFLDIAGTVSSDFFEDEFTLETLTAGKVSQNVIFKTYTPPRTFEELTHTIWMNGTFTTIGGESFPFTTQRELTVLPEDQTLVHTYTASPKELSRGEELTVTVTVENIAGSLQSVSASDSFPEELEHTFGDTSADATLQIGETKQLYVYKLEIPYDWREKNFTVTSTLTSDSLTSELSELITVLDPLEDVVVPEVNETNETVPEVIVETPEDNNVEIEKKSFFSSLIEGIAEFFAGFFS